MLGRRRGQPLEPPELAVDGLADLLRQRLLGDLGAQLLDLRGLVGGLAELLADGLELLPQEVLALPLLDLGGDLRPGCGAELDLWLAAEDLHGAQTGVDADRLEQLLALLGLEPERRGHG